MSNAIWHVILDADLARSQFTDWDEKFVLAFGNDIIASIPRAAFISAEQTQEEVW